MEVYRTDEQGTIIASSDGQRVTFNVKASPIKPNAPPANSTPQSTSVGGLASASKDVTFYVTNTGTKYHMSGCRSLSRSKIPIKLSELKGKYEPCKICNPPR